MRISPSALPLRLFAVLLLALGLGLTGCKKKDDPAGEKKTPQKVETEKKEKAVSKANEEAAKAKEAAEMAKKAEAAKEATPDPDKAKDDPEKAVEPPKPVGPDEEPTDPSLKHDVKPVAVDQERLQAVFVEMWCAEQRGVGPDEMMAIYQKYDYPPLLDWYSVWNRALADPQWARATVRAARSNCPDAAKNPVEPNKAGVDTAEGTPLAPAQPMIDVPEAPPKPAAPPAAENKAPAE